MKLLPVLQTHSNRRSNSFRSAPATQLDAAADAAIKSPATLFWLSLHALCCLISLVLGFRFSRIIFFLLFSPSPAPTTTTTFHAAAGGTLVVHPLRPPPSSEPASPPNKTLSSSRVVVGRHGIRIRPWPHPDPSEVMKAYRIIDRVQREQRLQYGVKAPRTLIAVTPTYARTFQTLHMTGVMHSLMNVPYEVVWIVVEAGGSTNETAQLLARSGLRVIHIGFKHPMPNTWEGRHRLENQMRLHALRVVRDEKLEGVVMFADDSNMHSLEFFDEIHKVNWVGAVSVGILAHSGNGADLPPLFEKDDRLNMVLPVQGPACNSSDQLVGWHIFNSLPYQEKRAKLIGDRAIVLPQRLEWAGFVFNSRLLWKDPGDKPEWVKDLDSMGGLGGDVSPLSLLKDPSVVEPLGSCGKKVLLWWLRVEARSDSKFPAGWIIDPPLEITVPAKRTPWPDAPPELPGNERAITSQGHVEKRTRRSKRSSRSKKKRETKIADAHDITRQSGQK